MREVSTKKLIELSPHFNTTNLLLDRLASGNETPLFSVKRGASWVDVSTADFVADVRLLTKTLIEENVKPGDRVAIMSRTRYEWALVEQAIWFAGAISVPIYETSSPFQVEWILRDSGARHVFTEEPQHAAVVRAALASLGEEVTIWPFESAGTQNSLDSIPASGLQKLLMQGASSAITEADVEHARSGTRLGDTATLVYTSGTTGRPKGCMMTHANFSEVAVNLAPHMAKVLGDGERTLMFLPLAHVFARAVQQVCLHAGSTIAHTPSAATLVEDMKAVKPGFLLAVPRIFEKIRATASATAESAGKGGLFAQAEAVAIEYSKAADARGRGFKSRRSPLLLAKHALFNKVLYPKLRAVLGGNARYTISGASALNPDLAHFFRGAGLGLLEGYGLTETTAPATVNLADDVRVGTVGIPIPGTTIRIAPDGEVLVRGIGVFAGYHNNPEASAGAFDAEGFFKTGDTGSLDEAGFLSITGRKKDILVTAGGKNVAPGPLEEYVRASRLISQVVVVGENRPFVGALITLDADELTSWCRANGLPAMSLKQAAAHPLVRDTVQRAIDAANTTVSQAENIRKFLILEEDFTEESGHMTPSMKLKRNSVIDAYAAQIDAIYLPVQRL
ncbi:long-chain fatty acid--CoA ligase [Arthrobacter sp. MYb227]|uniref:AMP-dependent synthetase/ligase n=1 Tax=Arthrobacter sp. MYb227 TaxID=1848601 RepID=UPI000CFCBE59|nr:AMP-dependent synthetase/ligase [Arthrobacter sp. MYb227]PQZ91060.1 long-chain fatty acid--CoA ligase [Arthrobacter sp. MYb227]